MRYLFCLIYHGKAIARSLSTCSVTLCNVSPKSVSLRQRGLTAPLEVHCAITIFPVRFPEKESAVANAQKSPVDAYRKRMKRQGLVRVEVQVRKEYAGLVREVATALGDPERETETRDLLREKVAPHATKGLKALLASAPLDGIDLDRPHDLGRDLGRELEL